MNVKIPSGEVPTEETGGSHQGVREAVTGRHWGRTARRSGL